MQFTLAWLHLIQRAVFSIFKNIFLQMVVGKKSRKAFRTTITALTCDQRVKSNQKSIV